MKKRRLFVGGLPFAMDDAGLKKLFEEGDDTEGAEGCGSGTVEDAIIIRDRETGRGRGFGFVTMRDEGDASKAIKMFNDLNYGGRPLKVDEAADKNASARSGDSRPPRRTGGYSSGFSDYPKKRERY